MKNSTLKNLAIFSSALFVGASALYLYSPVIGSHAAESKEAEVSLTVASTLGIRTSADNLNLEANVGDFVHGAINVDVTTNSQYGYTLTLEDSDSESSLVHTNTSISDKVTSEFEGAKTSAQLDDNTWGFSLNTTDYYYIPTLGNPAKLKATTDSTAGNYDTTAVDFGAKVGMSLTAGTYTDTVKFTAYVNGVDGNPADGTNADDPGTAPKRTIENITNMQDIIDDNTDDDDDDDDDDVTTSSVICANSAIGTVTTLTDSRNGNSYTIKKLKDGKCWMTDNLNIANIKLTSEKSNLPEGEEYTIPESSLESFDSSSAGQHVYIDPTYGGYYSFATVTAGWGASDSVRGNSPKDICPKGWRVATGGPGGDYAGLYEKYNSYALMQGEPNLINSGYVDKGSLKWQGNGGRARYWTSSVYVGQSAYYLYMTGATIYASEGSINKYYGQPVRCVAK